MHVRCMDISGAFSSSPTSSAHASPASKTTSLCCCFAAYPLPLDFPLIACFSELLLSRTFPFTQRCAFCVTNVHDCVCTSQFITAIFYDDRTCETVAVLALMTCVSQSECVVSKACHIRKFDVRTGSPQRYKQPITGHRIITRGIPLPQ